MDHRWANAVRRSMNCHPGNGRRSRAATSKTSTPDTNKTGPMTKQKVTKVTSRGMSAATKDAPMSSK